ncbi:transporter, partial [Candidatus Uhrbacteria bacterium CG_4_10_14_0_2_um_filter_41_7]
PRITVASFIAYLISQHHDVWAFHFWKKKTNGKHLWLRNNASTVVSQLIDTVVFTFIAFYGVLPIVPLILGTWVVKILIALIDTPFIYGAVWIMDKIKPKEEEILKNEIHP